MPYRIIREAPCVPFDYVTYTIGVYHPPHDGGDCCRMAEELAFARLLLCAGLNVSARSVPCRQSSRRFPRQPRSRLKSEEGERSVAAFFYIVVKKEADQNVLTCFIILDVLFGDILPFEPVYMVQAEVTVHGNK